MNYPLAAMNYPLSILEDLSPSIFVQHYPTFTLLITILLLIVISRLFITMSLANVVHRTQTTPSQSELPNDKIGGYVFTTVSGHHYKQISDPSLGLGYLDEHGTAWFVLRPCRLKNTSIEADAPLDWNNYSADHAYAADFSYAFDNVGRHGPYDCISIPKGMTEGCIPSVEEYERLASHFGAPHHYKAPFWFKDLRGEISLERALALECCLSPLAQ
jgi:hypothetical protein